MSLYKLTRWILVVYALLTIYTLVTIFVGIPYQPFFTPLLTLLAFVFALDHGSQNLGWKQMLLLLLLTLAVSLLFESLGVATGKVYGPYYYTDKLGYKFLGLVPLIIPVAWFMMTYPAYVIARRLTPLAGNLWVWRVMVAAVGGLIMTAWDLTIDPMMVEAGHWVWEQPGAYFGIPLQNYWGWWLTIFVAFFLFLSLGRIMPEQKIAVNSFTDLAVWSYAITGLSSILVCFEFGLDGPALVGIFAMLPWVVMGMMLPGRYNNPASKLTNN
jgi:uncharacterized membrane protein